MSSPTVLLAMSGGVDSSVAARLLEEMGMRVLGVTFLMAPEALSRPGGAPASEARAAASRLGVEHSVVDGRELFEARVLRPAWEALAAGLTPNPCATCNPQVKFELLLQEARRKGIEKVATGHYGRLEPCPEDGLPRLRRAACRPKDQSYFLHGLSVRHLSRLILPLGELDKEAVKRLARSLSLPSADLPESQDACFGESGAGMGESLRRYMGADARPGRILDMDGREVGRHAGLHRLTVGQRRGLNVALGTPAWVRRLLPDRGDVEVCTSPEALLRRSFFVPQASWLGRPPPEGPRRCRVQVRYRHRSVPCVVTPHGPGVAVTLEDPVRAVTPGQCAVFYDEDRLLGGGPVGR